MTDEERQKLVNRLRLDAEPTEGDCEDAADEIERLARDLEWTRERVKNLEQRLPLDK